LRPPQAEQHRENNGSSFHGGPVNVKGPDIVRHSFAAVYYKRLAS
jgi:hypothetical protein